MNPAISVVAFVKRLTGARTWQVEAVFVALVLCSATWLLNKQPTLVDWIGVLAVFFTWSHISVADRLAAGVASGSHVECHYKLARYAIAKEICWILYFTLLSAYPALLGCFLFLGYAAWRKVWRARSV